MPFDVLDRQNQQHVQVGKPTPSHFSSLRHLLQSPRKDRLQLLLAALLEGDGLLDREESGGDGGDLLPLLVEVLADLCLVDEPQEGV